MTDIVKVEDLTLIYQSINAETTALEDINLTIQKQEFVSIVGPSGCGKTTILSLIAGLIKPTMGKIFVNDKTPNPKDDLCGYMFQRDNLLPWRTVEKNVYLGLLPIFLIGLVIFFNSELQEMFVNFLD